MPENGELKPAKILFDGETLLDTNTVENVSITRLDTGVLIVMGHATIMLHIDTAKDIHELLGELLDLD